MYVLCTYTELYICAFICMYVYIRMYICTCVRLYICMYVLCIQMYKLTDNCCVSGDSTDAAISVEAA